ncbi:hypothetical protein C8Q75DRAFT_805987 [Abortiporus biennis]|nr:hypothetical protein C8Q75DRAFT_805987 [Abortiporus biennis]
MPLLHEAFRMFKEVCKGTCPKDSYRFPVWCMAGIHAVFIKGAITVYSKATVIPESKHVDFIGYALQWVASIKHRHRWELETYFPSLYYIYDTSVIPTQQESFLPGLNSLENYLVSCLPSGMAQAYGPDNIASQQQQYDGWIVRKSIDLFIESLVSHVSLLNLLLLVVIYSQADQQKLFHFAPPKLRAAPGVTETDLRLLKKIAQSTS